jgi:hypothetical protein
VTSRLKVLMPIPSRSLSTSLFRAVAMTWSPAAPRNQPLIPSTNWQAVSVRFEIPFEWNSFANECPMPPGEHLAPRS